MASDLLKSLYGLSIEAFLEGVLTGHQVEAPNHAAFGLTEAEAVELRKGPYANRIRAIRAKQGRAA
jgi:hypothetical protein